MSTTWANITIPSDLLIGRARSLVSDRDMALFVPDSITPERIASAKSQAKTFVFGSKSGGLASYVGRYSGGMTAILDRLAASETTSDIVQELIAIVFIHQMCLDRRTTVDSKWSNFADRVMADIERTVLVLDRIGPNALNLSSSSGAAVPLGGAAFREY